MTETRPTGIDSAPQHLDPDPHPDSGPSWTEVSPVDAVPFDRGVAALARRPDGSSVPVAVFRLSPDRPEGPEEWRAVSHVDPATGAPVMARGLVGSSVPIASDGPSAGDGSIPTVASPLHKQRYDLRTGRCLDDPTLSLVVYDVEVRDDLVWIRPSG